MIPYSLITPLVYTHKTAQKEHFTFPSVGNSQLSRTIALTIPISCNTYKTFRISFQLDLQSVILFFNPVAQMLDDRMFLNKET